MNSDSSELDTSSNSRGIFLPPNVPLRLSSSSSAAAASATANANSTSSLQRHHPQTAASGSSSSSKTPSSSTDGSHEFHLNELNAFTATKSPNGPAKYVSGELGKPQERYVWEMRSRSPNVTPASTVLNSPDLNVEAQFSLGQLQRHHHHQIRVGRSPGSQFEQPNSILPQGLTSPGSPTDGDSQGLGQQQQHQQQHLRDGEIVVFDDIDTNWMNKANSMTSSKGPSSLLYHQQQQQHQTGHHNHHHPHHHNHHHHHHHQTDDILKVTKMIGQLPIAEYEGSPRRFGNQPERLNGSGPQSGGVAAAGGGGPTVPKRPPGFPQRVSPKNPKVSPGLGHPQQQQHHNQRQQQEVNNPRQYPSVEQQQHQQSYYQQQQQQQQQQQHHQQQKQYYAAPVVTNANAGSNKSIGNLIDIGDGEADGVAGAEERGVAMGPTPTMVGHGMGLASQTPTFDYLYEFSETRKVLEEFFNANPDDEKRFTDFTESGDDLGSCQEDEGEKPHQPHQEQPQHIEQSYIGQRLARIPKEELYMVHRSPKKQQPCDSNVYIEHNDIELYIDSNSRSSGDLADTELEANMRRHSRNFTLSPETTDYDSNCGDLDSLSNDINCTTDYGKLYTSMPVLEDGLSSGHASDTENNTCAVVVPPPPPPNGGNGSSLPQPESELDLLGQSGLTVQQQQQQQQHNQQSQTLEYNLEGDNNCATSGLGGVGLLQDFSLSPQRQQQLQHEQLEHCFDQHQMLVADAEGCCLNNNHNSGGNNHTVNGGNLNNNNNNHHHQVTSLNSCHDLYANNDADGCSAGCDEAAYSPMSPSLLVASPQPASPIAVGPELHLTAGDSPKPPLPPSPPPQPPPGDSVPRPGRATKLQREPADIQEAMKEIRSALQRAKIQPEKLKFCDEVLPADPESPIWVPRSKGGAPVAAASNGHKGTPDPEEEADTDLETDRLLGQQRLDEQAYYDDKTIWPKTSRISGSPLQSPLEQSPEHADGLLLTSPTNSASLKPQAYSSATIRQGIGTAVTPNSPDLCQIVGGTDVTLTSPEKLQYAKSPTGSIKSLKDMANGDKKAKARNKEGLLDPSVLIEGVLFRARYLGSTQLVCEGQPTKSTRMMQAEEAVSRIKAPEGESQPSTEVDLFISTEKIMVLNTDLKEIMMDHALRTISYIADIGDLVVLMARRRFVSSDSASSGDVDTAAEGPNGSGDVAKDRKEPKENGKVNRTPKMICHVFESDEAQFIAQSIGQAFQVAYMEFLKANGIEDHSFVKEMDYQEVLNSQEIFGDELEIFAKKELQKEVVVPKTKGEILGVVIVESGWGSMLPTVVIANLMSTGSAARCGQLNIGDQLIAINGMSLVGLPLSTCQTYIRNAKNQTAVKFTVVPCPPVVEVKIKRPNTKYQLGFSVQNGVICSLLRGGIAERGGVRVGHRIIEINNQSVVAVPHEKIVNLLATSVGEILMKTMPTSMFRLLTGQENPIYI